MSLRLIMGTRPETGPAARNVTRPPGMDRIDVYPSHLVQDSSPVQCHQIGSGETNIPPPRETNSVAALIRRFRSRARRRLPVRHQLQIESQGVESGSGRKFVLFTCARRNNSCRRLISSCAKVESRPDGRRPVRPCSPARKSAASAPVCIRPLRRSPTLLCARWLVCG